MTDIGNFAADIDMDVLGLSERCRGLTELFHVAWFNLREKLLTVPQFH